MWSDQTWDDYYALHKTRCSDAHMGVCSVLPPVPSVMNFLEGLRTSAEQHGRTEERAGLIRDAQTQRAYYWKRFGHAPEWGDLLNMLMDDWLARQRNGEFDDEVAEKVREVLANLPTSD
jgi:hypothetical protein